jgi:hypothetical protein
MYFSLMMPLDVLITYSSLCIFIFCLSFSQKARRSSSFVVGSKACWPLFLVGSISNTGGVSVGDDFKFFFLRITMLG